MADQAEGPRVVRNDGRNRYEVWSGDTLAGVSQYRERGDRTVFTHTEVDEAFAGQGLGKALAAGAIEDVVRRGRVIVPLCPFIAHYLRENPRHDAHVRWPEAARDE
jgi:predicted GNAT family acetyltransferase